MAEPVSAVHGSSMASAKNTALAFVVNNNNMTDILSKMYFAVVSSQKNFNIKNSPGYTGSAKEIEPQ